MGVLAIRKPDGLWQWFALAIGLHVLAVVLGSDFHTNLKSQGLPERMTVRMAILPDTSPLPSETQPSVAPAPKPTPRSAPTPLSAPIPPVRETPPPEEVLPSEETASVTSVASVAPETPVAERALATIDSERASYVDRIRALVEARKRYPSMARRRGTEGVVLARFHLDEEGKVVSIWTDNAAASILSRSAREAVERAAPFPRPPHGSIVIEIPIRYALRQ